MIGPLHILTINGLYNSLSVFMIPKIIHCCWFGRGEMPELVQKCLASWHEYMPDWEYKLWNEDNFDVNSTSYTKEAYESKKYAFVSDYVRLKALYEIGGLYLDVDFEVLKPFDDLMTGNEAFAGFEGSKHLPVMMGVCASKAGGEWVEEMLDSYHDRHLIIDGKMDLTPNVTYLTKIMHGNGLVQNGKLQKYKDLTVFPVDYFCPRQTTGEYLKTENTYCDHLGMGSWSTCNVGWKSKVRDLVGEKNMTRLIKLKRKLFG